MYPCDVFEAAVIAVLVGLAITIGATAALRGSSRWRVFREDIQATPGMHAIALKRLIRINGGTQALNLEQMGAGRVLGLPEFGKNQNHLLQSDVARYFYLSQHFYKAFEEDFEDEMSAIDKLLRSGKYNDLVSADEMPPMSNPVAKP